MASSVSAGIISARARDIRVGPYDDFLQTDAAINPGNSGGPLFNDQGEVVGMNTAIIGGGTGIGFAVPANLLKQLLPQLEARGAVTRAWLGVTAQDLTPELALALSVPLTEGAVVSDLTERSPAKSAGILPDDVVVEVDGEKIVSAGTLTRTVALKHPGTRSALTLYRKGRRMSLPVTLGTRPDLEGVQARRRHEPVESRPQRLGMSVRDMDPELAARADLPREGALVTAVAPGGKAERAGLRPGMVIVEAVGKPVRGADDFRKAVASAKPGAVLLLRVHTFAGKALRAIPVLD
jgi:serine protease Do